MSAVGFVATSKWNAVTLRVRACFNHFLKVVIFRARAYFKMNSRGPLSLIFSLLFHIVFSLGLFSMADRNGRGGEGLVVEQNGTPDVMVTLHPAEPPSSALAGDSDKISSQAKDYGDSFGEPDLIPPRPAFPIHSDKISSSAEDYGVPLAASAFFGDDSLPPVPASIGEEEGAKGVSSGFSPEEEKAGLPDEPAHAPMPVLSSGGAGGTGDILREGEPPQGEAGFSLVGESDQSGKGEDGTLDVSDGAIAGEGNGIGHGSPGGGAFRMAGGDAFPGGGGGRGQTASRFAVPMPGGRFNPKPRYPEAARAEGREGTVLLKVTVLPTGKVGEAITERSSGHTDLDRAAVEAVMKWTFVPARRGENPVMASVRIPVTFKIGP